MICFNQTVNKKIDPKIHVNPLNELLEKLKPRPGILFLKRLSVILDEDSEKGFGLVCANAISLLVVFTDQGIDQRKHFLLQLL